MKITVNWSGTDADRVQAQAAQDVLEAAGLAQFTTFVVEGGRPFNA